MLCSPVVFAISDTLPTEVLSAIFPAPLPTFTLLKVESELLVSDVAVIVLLVVAPTLVTSCNEGVDIKLTILCIVKFLVDSLPPSISVPIYKSSNPGVATSGYWLIFVICDLSCL